MAMGVDQPRNDGAAPGIEAEIKPLGTLVPALEQPGDAPLAVDQQSVEAEQLALVVEAVAVRIIDQSVGKSGRSDQGQGGERRSAGTDDACDHVRGSRLTTEEMSRRPQPSACVSP